MGYQCFKPKKFSEDRLLLIEVCNDIISEYMSSGYQLTSRQLYYQLVSKDLIPNNVKSYDRIKNLINDARMAGVLDWEAIVDRGRSVSKSPTWSTPEGILRTAVRGFQVDPWEYQPCHVLVMCEKQALEGVLEPAANKWRLPYVSNKGYASVSLLYRIGQNFKDKVFSERKPVKIIYFGDHDPSGLDMDRDLLDRLTLFSGADYDTPELSVSRVALTSDQISTHKPPPNPAKLTDSRAKDYIAKHGSNSWELDALEPKILEQILDDEIDFILYDDEFGEGSYEIWDETLRLEKDMEIELKEIVGSSNSNKWSKRIDDLYNKRFKHLP